VIAEVEKPDGTWERLDMGAPVCGEDFCDGCGDCLACQYHDDEPWCMAGTSCWVIYGNDRKNPYKVPA
jgi:hypothetical protein